MHQIVEKQRLFFESNSTKDLKFRISQLNLLQKVLKENETQLYDAIYKDFKKSEFETYIGELALIYEDIREAKKNIYRWSKRKRVATNLLNFPARSYRIPEPLGVCLVIGAWNYPISLAFSPVIAAITAGNTVILKPSEIPEETSLLMTSLVNENFDPSFFKAIHGGIPETSELLEQKFDKIFFTGSTAVGKIVYQAAAKHLTPVTLELGGKSPAFVTKDCNLKMTVKRLIWAKFFNAGQTCIAPDYIMVDQSIKDDFLALSKKEIESQNYSISNKNYVEIINDKNFKRLSELISPEKVFHGGILNAEERIISPTILHPITMKDDVMKDEIFGPILPVISYTNLDEAIQQVKQLPKPLACYIYAKNRKVINKILSQVSFGGGAINDSVMHITNNNLPFGGVGSSGTGSYHGEAGFQCFSHYKSMLDKPTWIEFPFKYFPLSSKKLRIIKSIFKW